jgi:hypothetical protein
MLKGTAETISLFIGTLIFTAGVATAITYLVVEHRDFGGVMETQTNALKAIGLTHEVEQCFKEKSGADGMISADFLDKSQMTRVHTGVYKYISSISDICRISGVKASVVDIENGKEWIFPNSVREPDHSIWISIRYNDGEIHMGRLNVKLCRFC